MTRSRTRVVPLRELATPQLKYIGETPDGIAIDVAMTEEEVERLQRIIRGDKDFGLLPIARVDLAERAKLGDHEPLIQHFQARGALTEDERNLLAAIARRELSAPKNAPPKLDTEIRGRDVARFYLVLKALGGKRIADIANEKFRIDQSLVYQYVRKHKQQEKRSLFYLNWLLLAFGSDQTRAQDIIRQYANVTDADIDAARAAQDAEKRK
jgi:hypothetical protein